MLLGVTTSNIFILWEKLNCFKICENPNYRLTCYLDKSKSYIWIFNIIAIPKYLGSEDIPEIPTSKWFHQNYQHNLLQEAIDKWVQHLCYIHVLCKLCWSLNSLIFLHNSVDVFHLTPSSFVKFHLERKLLIRNSFASIILSWKNKWAHLMSFVMNIFEDNQL